jgi:hypothetical protein
MTSMHRSLTFAARRRRLEPGRLEYDQRVPLSDVRGSEAQIGGADWSAGRLAHD